MGHSDTQSPVEQESSSKIQNVTTSTVVEAMTICILASVDLECPQPKVVDGMEVLPLDQRRLDCTVKIGQKMAKEIRNALVGHLRGYKDVFAFDPEEMPGISLVIIEHRLNVDPADKLVTQKKRQIGPKRSATAMVEV